MNDAAAIGDNSANVSEEQKLEDALTEKYGGLLRRMKERTAECERVPVPITNEADAAKATDLVGACRNLADESKEAHGKEKAPWLAGCRVFDKFFLRRNEDFAKDWAPVATAVDRFRNTVKAVQRAQVPPGSVVEAPRIEGAYGTTASDKIEWRFEIIDPTKIPLGFLMPDERAIQAAIYEAKGEIEIPGIKVIKVEGTQFRRRGRSRR